MTAAVVARRRQVLVTSLEAVIYLRKAFQVELKPATIRQWAKRGHIGAHGGKRERYDLWEVVEHVKRQKTAPTKGDKHGRDQDGSTGR